MLLELINFDTRSLIGILVWGNIATGTIVFLYQIFNHYKSNHNVIRNMTIIRFLSAIGYLLLFYRNDIHDFISVNIGNTLLFLCHYMEARLILELANITSKRINTVLTTIFAIDVFAFNLLEFHFRDPSIRVGLASVIIFSIFLLPTVQLMFSKRVSKFKKGISVFYLFLLLALIPRGIEAFLDKTINILSNNYFQTLLFLSFILMMISNTIIYLLFIKEQMDKLIWKMATLDNLTNILNRRSFLEQGKSAFERHKSSKTRLALLFLDIDHFKNANDKYGHQFGDEVLTRFTEVIKNNSRPNDLCCRYGGDEFIVLLKNVDENVGVTIANRIMGEFEKTTFESHSDFHITTSVGNITGIPKNGEVLEDYIKMADEALYQAKKAGRNKLITNLI